MYVYKQVQNLQTSEDDEKASTQTENAEPQVLNSLKKKLPLSDLGVHGKGHLLWLRKSPETSG